MAGESIWLMETSDRALGFAVYDELRKSRGSYVEAEVRVDGDTIKVYAKPFYDVAELQPGPKASFNDTMVQWRAFVDGFTKAWKLRCAA